MLLYPLPVLLTSIPVTPFTTVEVIGCTTDAAKGASKAPRNPQL